MAFYDLIGLAYWALVFIVPPITGFALARKWPNNRGWKNALYGALPASIPAFFFAIFLHVTEVSEPVPDCVPPECGYASVYTFALYGVAVFVFAVGFALAAVGHVFGKKTRPEG